MGYYERKVEKLLAGCMTADRNKIEEAMNSSRTLFNNTHVSGASINSKNANEETALMLAIVTGNRDLVKFVMSKGADIHLKNKAGETALMYAAKLGFKDIMTDLLDKQAAINDTNHKGENALMYAVDNKQSQTAGILIARKALVNEACNEGRTALMRASAKGDSMSLIALLDASANIDAKDISSRTALMHGVIGRSRNTVLDLLGRGANYEMRDNSQKTAADYAGWLSEIGKDIKAHIEKIAQADLRVLQEAAVIAATEAAAAVTPVVSREDKIRDAMNAEGLDTAACEHWLPIGKAAIEYVMAGTDSPKLLSNTFNFAAKQYVTVSKNMLTGEKAAEVAGALDSFPNQELVADAYAKLLALGKTPPAWERKVRIKEL